MADYKLVNAEQLDLDLTALADVIRAKSRKNDSMLFPAGMVDEINAISIEEYTIQVTVDSGSIVTATNGAETVTGTSNGVCELKVHSDGDWTVSAVLDGADSNIKTVNVYNSFSTALVYFTANVIVNTSAGAIVTCAKDEISFSDTADDSGIVTFLIREPGDWVITSEKEDKSLTDTVVIEEERDYPIYLPLDLTTLNSCSWEQIKQISDAGDAKNYWSIGDCKAVTLSGKMGTKELDETLYVYILGFDHNSELEGSGVHFGGFKTESGVNGINVCLVDSVYNNYFTNGTKYFNMNHWGGYNYGGWAACDMRYDILGSTDVAPSDYGTAKKVGSVGYDPSATCAISPVENTLMSCLPADLRAVMKPVTKYSDNVAGKTDVETNITATLDYLPLLGEYEIFGIRSYANSYEQNYQEQYEYFAAGNSKVKYRDLDTTSTAIWWERSPCFDDVHYFCLVSPLGYATYYTANYSYGVAPAFVV